MFVSLVVTNNYIAIKRILIAHCFARENARPATFLARYDGRIVMDSSPAMSGTEAPNVHCNCYNLGARGTLTYSTPQLSAFTAITIVFKDGRTAHIHG